MFYRIQDYIYINMFLMTTVDLILPLYSKIIVLNEEDEEMINVNNLPQNFEK